MHQAYVWGDLYKLWGVGVVAAALATGAFGCGSDAPVNMNSQYLQNAGTPATLSPECMAAKVKLTNQVSLKLGLVQMAAQAHRIVQALTPIEKQDLTAFGQQIDGADDRAKPAIGEAIRSVYLNAAERADLTMGESMHRTRRGRLISIDPTVLDPMTGAFLPHGKVVLMTSSRDDAHLPPPAPGEITDVRLVLGSPSEDRIDFVLLRVATRAQPGPNGGNVTLGEEPVTLDAFVTEQLPPNCR